MNQTIILMKDFLTSKNYDINVGENKLTVVKHSDDPWNNFNKIIARPDGVYNYVELQMGGYSEKKRVSCKGFETACFLVLAMCISGERKKFPDDLLITEIKKHIDFVVNNSSECWRGQFIIDKLISLTN